MTEAIAIALAAYAVVSRMEGGDASERPEQGRPRIRASAPEALSRHEVWSLAYWVSGDTEFSEFAVRMVPCESSGIPTAKNPTSSASGLAQVIESSWNLARRLAELRPEVPTFGTWASSRFHALENMKAAWALYGLQGPSGWAASEGCWG